MQDIGSFIKKHRMRVSMHPDQFVVLNSRDEGIAARSVAELVYHADVLDLLGTSSDAKIQIHLGGVYGNKAESISRFIKRVQALPRGLLKRLVIENDERHYCLRDCLAVHTKTGLPVVLDVFHHSCNNSGESIREAILLAGKTWRKQDGPPIIDYSMQQKGKRPGTHTQSIDLRHFRTFLDQLLDIDADISIPVVCRLIIGPFIAMGLAALFGVNGAARLAGITEAGMPSAVVTTIIASEYKIEPQLVTAIIFIGTVLSPFTLTPLLVFLSQ